MGIESTGYKLVLWLHILCAIVGFGAVFLNGVYGALAKKEAGPEGLAISEAVEVVADKWATWFIYAVFVFGFVLVLLSDGAFGFGDVWVLASIGLFIIALLISHGLHRPNLRRMLDLQRELVAMGPPPASAKAAATAGADPGDNPQPAIPPSGTSQAQGPPPQALELEARGKKAGLYGAVLNLLMVGILALMVWQPIWL